MKLVSQLLHNRKAMTGLVILTIIVLVAIFAPLLTEYSPVKRVGRPHHDQLRVVRPQHLMRATVENAQLPAFGLASWRRHAGVFEQSSVVNHGHGDVVPLPGPTRVDPGKNHSSRLLYGRCPLAVRHPPQPRISA